MFNKPVKTKKNKNHSLKRFKTSIDCKASKASNEIMLNRFYNGDKIEFPFST